MFLFFAKSYFILYFKLRLFREIQYSGEMRMQDVCMLSAAPVGQICEEFSNKFSATLMNDLKVQVLQAFSSVAYHKNVFM